MSAQIVPDANDSISEEYSEEPVVKGKTSFVDSTIELPEKNEEPEEVETEKPTDPVQKYLPLIRVIIVSIYDTHSDDMVAGNGDSNSLQRWLSFYPVTGGPRSDQLGLSNYTYTE